MFTFNDHLYYTIGGRKFGSRTNSIEPYCVHAGQVDLTYYKKNYWRQELRRIADLVYTDFGKDLVLFLSGGTDSEIVLRNFLEIGVKPHCIIIRFKNGYNSADVDYAIKLASHFEVKFTVVDFDIIDFYMSGQAAQLSKDVASSELAYLIVFHHIKKLCAPSILSGEILLKRHADINDSFWYLWFDEDDDASVVRFSNMYHLPVVNEWFSYTPEAMLYYLESPLIQELVTTKNNKLSSTSSKNAVLKNLYPEIELREKTHGFEKLQGFKIESRLALKKNFIANLEQTYDGIKVDQLIKHLRGHGQ